MLVARGKRTAVLWLSMVAAENTINATQARSVSMVRVGCMRTNQGANSSSSLSSFIILLDRAIHGCRRAQAIGTVELGIRCAVTAHEEPAEVNEAKPRVSPDSRFDETVGFHREGPQTPGRSRRRNRDVEDECLGDGEMDLGHEHVEALSDVHGRRRSGPRDVVGAGKEHDGGRMVGHNNTIRVADHVVDQRLAEAPVDGRQRRQVFFQRRPEREARTADEDDGPRDRSVAAITSLKRSNAVFPGTGQPPPTTRWRLGRPSGLQMACSDLRPAVQPPPS